jgi:DNA primase
VEVVSDHLTLKRRAEITFSRPSTPIKPSFAKREKSFTALRVEETSFNFLMRYEHLGFPEAVERVAMVNIVIEQTDGRQDKKDAKDRESLHQRKSGVIVKCCCAIPEGRKALSPAQGIEEALAERYYLGYALQNGRGREQLRKRIYLCKKPRASDWSAKEAKVYQCIFLAA